MKILFLDHGQYITVGVPKLIELAEELSVAGHQVEVALTSRHNRFRRHEVKRNGVTYQCFPSLMWGGFRHGAGPWDTLRRILWYSKHFDFDIIHARDSRPTVILPAMWLRRKFGTPVVLEWADYFSGDGTIKERSSPLYRMTLGRIEELFETGFRLKADGATVVSRFLERELAQRGFDGDRILISRNGGKMDGARQGGRDDARRRLGWDGESVRAVYFGRIFDTDLDLLVNAMDMADASCPTLRLQIVGDLPTRRRRSHPQIDYEGWTPAERFEDFGRAADFFILPMNVSVANRARWPSKMGDYLSFGKPVLSTRVSDFEEIYASSDIGLLSDDTHPALGQALVDMVKQRDRWEEWGRNALRYGQEQLDWKVIATRLADFYERIIARE